MDFLAWSPWLELLWVNLDACVPARTPPASFDVSWWDFTAVNSAANSRPLAPFPERSLSLYKCGFHVCMCGMNGKGIGLLLLVLLVIWMTVNLFALLRSTYASWPESHTFRAFYHLDSSSISPLLARFLGQLPRLISSFINDSVFLHTRWNEERLSISVPTGREGRQMMMTVMFDVNHLQCLYPRTWGLTLTDWSFSKYSSMVIVYLSFQALDSIHLSFIRILALAVVFSRLFPLLFLIRYILSSHLREKSCFLTHSIGTQFCIPNLYSCIFSIQSPIVYLVLFYNYSSADPKLPLWIDVRKEDPIWHLLPFPFHVVVLFRLPIAICFLFFAGAVRGKVTRVNDDCMCI